MASTPELRNANLDSLLKSELIQLCHDHGLLTYGLKSQLIAQLLTYSETIPSLPAEIARQAQQHSPAVSRSAHRLLPPAPTPCGLRPEPLPTRIPSSSQFAVENSLQGMEECLRSSLRPLLQEDLVVLCVFVSLWLLLYGFLLRFYGN